MITSNEAGIYVHIPFCLKKCLYCDFVSQPSDDARLRKAYAGALLKEIGFYGEKYGKNLKVNTVFFGGGTPSLMEPALIGKIIDSLRKYFRLTPDCEISMECNPATAGGPQRCELRSGDLAGGPQGVGFTDGSRGSDLTASTAERLREYRKAGVNRLSIGVQSFNDETLKALGRVHTAAEAEATINAAREAGFDNVNIDLMFGVPGQYVRNWNADVKKAIALRPEHISVYSLEIAEGTPFYRMLASGEIKETPAERDRKMYAHALDALEAAGYNHYEISNLALPGRECRHNLKYWDMSQYLGLGAAAHSFMGGVRYSNLADTEEYIKAARSQDRAGMRMLGSSKVFGADCVGSFYENTFSDNISEFAFTALRKKEGIVYADFAKKMKNDFWDVYAVQKPAFEKFVRQGYAVSDFRHAALTRKGIDISNKIMALFV